MSAAHRIALRARPGLHYVYSGRSLLTTNLDGWVCQDSEGFYVQNTRLLSRDELTINGQSLTMVACSPVGGDRLLAYYEAPLLDGLPEKSIYVEVARAVTDGMRTEVRVTNYDFQSTEAAVFDLQLHLAADFADSEEVAGIRLNAPDQPGAPRQQCAPVETTWDEEKRQLTFLYAHRELDRAAVATVHEPAQVSHDSGFLVFPLTLQPRESTTISVSVEPRFDGATMPAPASTSRTDDSELARLRTRLHARAPRLVTTNSTVARAWQTAVADLASLPLGLPTGLATPMAGLPLYQQFFGRDSLTIGWQSLMAFPDLLRDSFHVNAEWQGTTVDNWLDEEPGKMIHQARWGPISLLGIDPFIRYYGEYSAPQDFIAMLGEYVVWTNDVETARELWPAVQRALEWMQRYGDSDDDGFLEYKTKSSQGVKNQGWKDSHDAIVDEHGQIVENPIASSDLQCYWFTALQQAAYIALRLGKPGEAWRLLRQGNELKKRFHEKFWMEEGGCYAMALGPDKQQVRTRSSNNGHLLAAGIVPQQYGPQIAGHLMAPDFFSGWGIRTLPDNHPAYNPFSYHRGSVWPIEQGVFAFGLLRYGCWDHLQKLAEGFFAASDVFVDNRLPEVMSGLPRDEDHPHPGVYPGSCEPQGWSASAVVQMVQCLLGIHPFAPLNLTFVDPHLSEWLADVRLEGLRVGESVLDIDFRRKSNGQCSYGVSRRQGGARAIRQPPPNQQGVNLLHRAWAALSSLPHS